MIVYSTYQLHNGEHWLWIRSGPASPIVDALTKISVLFPDLTFDTSIWGEFGNFAYKGTIKAGVVDLHEDVEAMQQYDAEMERCGAFAKPGQSLPPAGDADGSLPF
jgi:hypothetical protein